MEQRETGRGDWACKQSQSHGNCAGVGLGAPECGRIERVQAAQLHLIEYASGHTVEEFLRRFLDKAEELTGSKIGFYHFLGDDQNTLWLQIWSTNTLRNMCTAEGAGLHYPVSQAGVWVDCVHERKPVIHNDYASLAHRKGLPEGHAPVVREVVVPVMRGDRIVAIIGVGNKETDYDQEDANTVRRLADLAWETILRRQAEEALRISEEKYRALYENAPLPYQSLDENGAIIDVNPAWLKTLGYDRGEVLGRSFADFLHPDWKPVFERRFPELKRSGCAHGVEHRMRHKEGHYLDVSFEAHVGRRSDGSFRQTYCVFQDITDQKIAAQSLVASEKRFKTIVNSSNDGILIADLPSKKFVMCNPRIAAMLGYSQEELSHLGMPDVHSPEDLPAVLHAFESLARGDRDFVESIPMMRKDGSVFFADISSSHIELDGQEYIVAFFRDVTERIRAQAMARQYAADLAHASRLSTLGEMASGLAHEINQPLCAIVNYANSCKRMFTTPTSDLSMMSEVLEEIAAQADRAAKIVSRMRSLVQKQPQHRSPAHVGALIKAVLELSEAEAMSLGVDVILEIDKPGGCVYVDAILIQQVILNLVRNAFESMRGARDGRKQLTIRGRRGCGHTVEITISDTGEGIDEKDFDRVFDSFFTTKPDGIGIGLSISKSIITSYGGSIWVTRNPDRGVTFHFTLPLKKDTDDS